MMPLESARSICCPLTAIVVVTCWNRVTQTQKAMNKFFERTVPDTIERQSGPVVRRMLRSRESFDIENTKLRAREAAIIAKFKVHRNYVCLLQFVDT